VLPLAPEPLTHCSQCGSRATPPLGPSFVYGIGALGFQHCPVCGHRWRCLWTPGRRRRGASLRAAAITAALALVAGAGVAAYATTRPSRAPELAAATRGAGAAGVRGPLPLPGGVPYLVIVAPSNAARTDLMQFLAAAPPATPYSEIARRVAAFATIARKTDVALRRFRWPASVAPSVAALIAADETLTRDLARGDQLLNRSSFGRELEVDAAALYRASVRVRYALGLAPVRPLDDSRFSQL